MSGISLSNFPYKIDCDKSKAVVNGSVSRYDNSESNESDSCDRLLNETSTSSKKRNCFIKSTTKITAFRSIKVGKYTEF